MSGVTDPDQDGRNRRRIGGIGCLGWILAIFFVLAIVAACNAFIGTGSDGDASGAEDACKDLVEVKLESPVSSNVALGHTATSDNEWVVRGVVAVTNSRGARTSTAWRCEVTLVGDIYRGSAELDE